MDIGNWITLGAVVVALGIGVASILHTQSLQRKERKERLLNEIIEWALSISKCSLKSGYKNIRDTTSSLRSRQYSEVDEVEEVADKTFWLLEETQSAETAELFRDLEKLGQYMCIIAETFNKEYSDDLHNNVLKLNEHLDSHSKLLAVKTPPLDSQEHYNRSSDIGVSKRALDKLANKVIEEATKIKTKDIA